MVVFNLNVTVSQVQEFAKSSWICHHVLIRLQLDLNLNSKHRQTCYLAAYCCQERDAPPPLSHDQWENSGTRHTEAHASPTWARSCVFPWSCAPVLGIVWGTAWSLWYSLTDAPPGQSPRVRLRATVATTVEFRPPKKFKLREPVRNQGHWRKPLRLLWFWLSQSLCLIRLHAGSELRVPQPVTVLWAMIWRHPSTKLQHFHISRDIFGNNWSKATSCNIPKMSESEERYTGAKW